MPKRVLIADDHELILTGVERLLSSQFEIVGTVRNGRAVVAEAKRLHPDVVVLDIGMPELNGIQAADQIISALPHTLIVFLTQQLGKIYIQSAFRAGARAYVAKQSASTELEEAILLAIRGSYFVTPLALEKLPDLLAIRNTKRNPGELFRSDLTQRQREVLQLVAEGKANKEIAVALDISVKTVNFHKAAIMDQLGLRTTAELTRYALSNGIICND